MTEYILQDSALPNSLDGKAPLPPAKLEGKMVIPEPYNRFFTVYEDYALYITHQHGRYKWETTNEYLARQDKYYELLDMVDHEYLIKYYEDILTQKRLAKKQLQKPNRYEFGAREFTFTYSPKWFDDTEARLQMSTAIQKLCKYYKDEIIQLRAVGEVGSNGLSHIHCFYKLRAGLKITDKNFKRAYSPWDTKIKQGPTGHKGGHHATVKCEADFSGYIEKDISNAWFEVNIDNSADPS